MKTNLQFWFASFILVAGVPTYALDVPGFEKPYTEARLLEIADGHEIDSGYEKTMSLERLSDSQSPVAIEITEEKKLPCKELPCGPVLQKSAFVITKSAPAGCGSTRYDGVESSQPGTISRKIEVIDHSTRNCDDKDYQWELILKEQGHKARYLVGTAE